MKKKSLSLRICIIFFSLGVFYIFKLLAFNATKICKETLFCTNIIYALLYEYFQKIWIQAENDCSLSFADWEWNPVYIPTAE